MECPMCGKHSVTWLYVNRTCSLVYWPEGEGPLRGYYCSPECIAAALAAKPWDSVKAWTPEGKVG